MTNAEALESLDAQLCHMLKSYARHGEYGVFVRTSDTALRVIVAGLDYNAQAEMLREAANSLEEENAED